MMINEPFQIEFTYQDISYIGLVTPVIKNKKTGYLVDLESENQESNMRITLTPSNSALEDWDFECGEGEPATEYYDKDLLEEVGEAIEKYNLTDGQTIGGEQI
jgi:hypothetical protein